MQPSNLEKAFQEPQEPEHFAITAMRSVEALQSDRCTQLLEVLEKQTRTSSQSFIQNQATRTEQSKGLDECLASYEENLQRDREAQISGKQSSTDTTESKEIPHGSVVESSECFRIKRLEPDLFPLPTGIDINMMPIDYDDLGTVPKYCRQYLPLIKACPVRFSRSGGGGSQWMLPYEADRRQRNIVYLTIQEGYVPVGASQRRTGLHIERPGLLRHGGKLHHTDEYAWGWGMGSIGDFKARRIPKIEELYDGIWMASTVSDTCRIYSRLVDDPEHVTDVFGGVEHKRDSMGPGTMLKAGDLCWMTDRTPHESLPVTAPSDDPDATVVHRSFFRLVVGQVSVWYSEHNTPNPTGLQPGCPIIHSSKFVKGSSEGTWLDSDTWDSITRRQEYSLGRTIAEAT